MSDNVIDAGGLFGPEPVRRRTPLDSLRSTKRVPLADRPVIAQRLGELAARGSPQHPRQLAKQWFERIWEGDRWAKRKRLICFPGEVAPEPGDDGAYVASGADWAALIAEAARSLVPQPGTTAEREREQLVRDALRGTSYVPRLSLVPLRAESAQSLLSALVHKVSTKIAEDTDLCRLWNLLQSTPFTIESYRADREAATFSGGWVGPYEGDDYSRSPLGEVSKCAADASQFRYRQANHWRYRFRTCASAEDTDWALPLVRLGLRGHRRGGRIFIIPQNFLSELPPDPNRDDEEVEECVVEWLVAKGLSTGQPYEKLPELQFDPEKGFGWREFQYDLVQTVWLEVRPRADGTPGFWVTVDEMDLPYRYPSAGGFDTLATEARFGKTGLNFIGMDAGETGYEFLEWPSYNPIFMDGDQLPAQAFSGLVDLPFEDLPSVKGWIDDHENVELQDSLFRNPERVRFCPSFPIDETVPPPCQPATIAAAVFQNAATAGSDLLGRTLLDQATTLSSAGLRFYQALLNHHRAVIDRMLQE